MSTLRCVGWPSSSIGQRAPLAGHRAVVDDGDERRGDELAGLAAVHAGALADEVGLEAVAARLVEQHAAGAVLDDDGHRARRRRAGVELGDRLAGGVAGQLLDVDGVEDLEPDRVAHRLEAGLHAGVAVGDGADAQQAADDLVVGEQPVAVGDEHPLAAVAVAGRDLDDGRAGGAGGVVDPPQQLDLVRLGDLVGDSARRCCIRLPFGAREGHGAGPAATLAGGRRGGLGGGAQPALGEVAGVGEAGGLAGDDADAGAPVAAARHLLDAPVVEPGRRRALVLGVDLGELAAGPHRRRQHPFEDVVVDHPVHATGGSRSRVRPVAARAARR